MVNQLAAKALPKRHFGGFGQKRPAHGQPDQHDIDEPMSSAKTNRGRPSEPTSLTSQPSIHPMADGTVPPSSVHRQMPIPSPSIAIRARSNSHHNPPYPRLDGGVQQRFASAGPQPFINDSIRHHRSISQPPQHQASVATDTMQARSEQWDREYSPPEKQEIQPSRPVRVKTPFPTQYHPEDEEGTEDGSQGAPIETFRPHQIVSCTMSYPLLLPALNNVEHRVDHPYDGLKHSPIKRIEITKETIRGCML